MTPSCAGQLQFDHIGIVVPDVDKGCASFSASIALCGFTQRFDDHLLGVSVRFARDASGIVYEFIAPLGDKSPVARSLAAKTNLLNQIAYRTASLEEAEMAMRDAGNFPLGEAKPALAFGGAKVQFFWCALGFIIELIENPDHTHDFSATQPGGVTNA